MKKYFKYAVFLIFSLITLVACQKEEDHYISFYADGVLVDKINVKEFSEAPNNVPSKTGYNFVGWYIYEDGNKQDFDEDDLDLGKDLMVYAEYSNQIVVNYYLDNELYYTENLEYGDYLFFIEEPIKEEFLFSGWYLDSNLTTIAKEEVKLTTDTNLYGSMVDLNQEFMVTLIYDDEEVEVETIEQKLVYSDPYKEGYTFSGWYLDSNLTEAFDINSQILTDLTLYGTFIEVIPEYKRLSAPTYTVNDLEGVLTLNAVSGATGYEIWIYNADNEEIYNREISTKSLTISLGSYKAGKYYVDAVSYGDGQTTVNSTKVRSQFTYRALPTVTDLEFDYETMTLTFSPLGKEYSYVEYYVSINDDSYKELEEGVYSYTLPNTTEPGNVKINVKATKSGYTSSVKTYNLDNFRLNVSDYIFEDNVIKTDSRTITYIVNNNVVNEVEYKENDVIEPYIYQSGNYIVTKWYLDEDYNTLYSFNTDLTKDLTLYGRRISVSSSYEIYTDPTDVTLNISNSTNTYFYVLITKRNSPRFSLPRPTSTSSSSSRASYTLTIKDVYKNEVVKEISSITNTSSYSNTTFDGDNAVDEAGTLYLVSMKYNYSSGYPARRTMTLTTTYEDTKAAATFNYDSLIVEIDGIEQLVEERNFKLPTEGYKAGDIINLRYKLFDSTTNYIASMYSDEIHFIFDGDVWSIYNS